MSKSPTGNYEDIEIELQGCYDEFRDSVRPLRYLQRSILRSITESLHGVNPADYLISLQLTERAAYTAALHDLRQQQPDPAPSLNAQTLLAFNPPSFPSPSPASAALSQTVRESHKHASYEYTGKVPAAKNYCDISVRCGARYTARTGCLLSFCLCLRSAVRRQGNHKPRGNEAPPPMFFFSVPATRQGALLHLLFEYTVTFVCQAC